MINKLYEEILDHFTTTPNEPLVIQNNYDLSLVESFVTIEEDSTAASRAVKDLGLSYSIDAKHKAEHINGEEVVNSVDIVWKFWKGE